MREVTRQEFFLTINDRDVHPTPFKDHTIWMDQGTRKMVGKSKPGYQNGGKPGVEKRWWLVDENMVIRPHKTV